MSLHHHPFLLLLLLTPTLATLLRMSPEPEIDPLSPPPPHLFLVSLSRTTPTTTHPLTKSYTLCPRKIPHFTIQCLLTPPYPSSVSFFVNGIFQRTERYTPYYIAGDYENVVYPWIPPPHEKVWRVKCQPDDREAVYVNITVGC